jgi:hypothetical protein
MSKQRRITVDLQSGGPQTWHAIGCNSPFPGTKFFLREFIAAARFLKIDRSATHCSNNRGLAACDPALGRAGRQLDSSSASAQQYFAGSQTIHVSLPRMPGSWLSLRTHLELSAKILVEMEVANGSGAAFRRALSARH